MDEVAPGEPAGPYQESELSDAPVVIQLVHPVYPPALRAAGVEGAVQVTYVVSPGGGVEPETITIVSSDHPSMAIAVREALLRARFRPGKVRGTPVRALVRQTIRFSLMSL
jgi:TonB family protein